VNRMSDAGQARAELTRNLTAARGRANPLPVTKTCFHDPAVIARKSQLSAFRPIDLVVDGYDTELTACNWWRPAILAGEAL
jgi:hypothetical protein